MILPLLAQRFSAQWGELPSSYLSFDIETMGLVRDWDLPVEIGHTLVVDRKPVETTALLLDWTRHPSVDQEWLRDRLQQCKFNTEHTKHGMPSGKTYHFTFERLRDEGVSPQEALTYYHDLLLWARREYGAFIGQNAWFFDAELFPLTLEEFTGREFSFADNELFDTGGLFKAASCRPPLLPATQDTLRSYFLRVRSHCARGVRWNIGHCVDTLGILADGWDPALLHTAGTDSFVVHRLFERLRELLQAALVLV